MTSLLNLQVAKRGQRLIQAAVPGGHDKHFRQRERVGAEVVVHRFGHQPFCSRMVFVYTIEVGDEYARVEHDHVGHSSRRLFR